MVENERWERIKAALDAIPENIRPAAESLIAQQLEFTLKVLDKSGMIDREAG